MNVERYWNKTSQTFQIEYMSENRHSSRYVDIQCTHNMYIRICRQCTHTCMYLSQTVYTYADSVHIHVHVYTYMQTVYTYMYMYIPICRQCTHMYICRQCTHMYIYLYARCLCMYIYTMLKLQLEPLYKDTPELRTPL